MSLAIITGTFCYTFLSI